MKPLFLALLCTLSIFGAAQAGPIASAVQKITVDDLNNALADANAQSPPDTRHAQCWQALIPFVQGWQAASILPTKPGLALLVQKTFDAKQLVGKPLIPDAVVTACALTLSDANLTLAQITAALGITAIAIPKLPFLP